jgi:hypothetical protein
MDMKKSLLLAAVAAVTLAACGKDEKPKPAPAPTPAVKPAAPAPSPSPTATPNIAPPSSSEAPKMEEKKDEAKK